jgi:hypothetical protein
MLTLLSVVILILLALLVIGIPIEANVLDQMQPRLATAGYAASSSFIVPSSLSKTLLRKPAKLLQSAAYIGRGD